MRHPCATRQAWGLFFIRTGNETERCAKLGPDSPRDQIVFVYLYNQRVGR